MADKSPNPLDRPVDLVEGGSYQTNGGADSFDAQTTNISHVIKNLVRERFTPDITKNITYFKGLVLRKYTLTQEEWEKEYGQKFGGQVTSDTQFCYWKIRVPLIDKLPLPERFGDVPQKGTSQEEIKIYAKALTAIEKHKKFKEFQPGNPDTAGIKERDWVWVFFANPTSFSDGYVISKITQAETAQPLPNGTPPAVTQTPSGAAAKPAKAVSAGNRPLPPGYATSPQKPRTEIEDIIIHYAKLAGVPNSVFFALVQQESGFNPNAFNFTGPDLRLGGAVGLTQMTGAAFEFYKKKYGKTDPRMKEMQHADLADPDNSMLVSMYMMRGNKNKWGMRPEFLFCSWNAGGGCAWDNSVKKAQVPKATRDYYVPNCMKYMKEWEAKGINSRDDKNYSYKPWKASGAPATPAPAAPATPAQASSATPAPAAPATPVASAASAAPVEQAEPKGKGAAAEPETAQ